MVYIYVSCCVFSTNIYNFSSLHNLYYNNEHKMLKHKHLLTYYVQLLLILATCFGRYCPSSGHNIALVFEKGFE
jgi:hypothetical protein